MKAKGFIFSGQGLNCEKETLRFIQSEFPKSDLYNLTELKTNPARLLECDFLIFPGGFSFGDEIEAGVIGAKYLLHYGQNQWMKILDKKIPILGICNGFQILCELGVFGPCALGPREDQLFSGRWEIVAPLKTTSDVWKIDENSDDLYPVPVRNKSGRLIFSNQDSFQGFLGYQANSSSPFHYRKRLEENHSGYAAILNKHGQILGMMPHPEGVYRKEQLPHWHKGQKLIGEKLLQCLKNYF